jgi:hypothetical protein
MLTKAAAKEREATFKKFYGQPPVPAQRYAQCRRGHRLRDALLKAARTSSWEAGYIEAVFAVGNSFNLIFDLRFKHLWQRIGVPPGPWPALSARCGGRWESGPNREREGDPGPARV